jgi:diacylglycerol kinase (ATP)
VFAIFNPAAGRGRGARLIETYLPLLTDRLPDLRHAVTSQPGNERELADQAIADGYDTVVAMGGDGTLSHVADRLAAAERDVRFGVLPAGTGNDLCRNLGIDHRDPAGAVQRLVAGRSRRIDVGRIHTASRPDARPDLEPRPRHFLNVVGFGFDIAVIDAAESARFLRGEILYKVTALQQLFRFPGFEAALRNGSEVLHDGETLMLTVSNGRYFGGGFPIAPDASLSDGALHACRIADAGPLERAVLFNKAERGRHLTSARVRIHAASGFQLEFPAPPRFEADGDVFVSSASTVELEVLPNRLPVLVG